MKRQVKILLFINGILLFFTNYIYSYRTIKIYEESSPLYPIDVITLQESSIITIRLANNCSQGGNQNSPNTISLRSFYPNGTIVYADPDFTDSGYNFCPLDRISISALPDNILFISYLREESTNQVRFMGMITTIDGTVMNPGFILSDALNLDIKGTTPYLSHITTVKTNNGTVSGGLLFTIKYDNLNIGWRKLGWDHIGKELYNISQGVFTPPTPSGQYELDSFQTFETLEGEYGLVYSISATNPQLETSSRSLIYFTLLHKLSSIWTPPTIIYETSLDAKILIKSCTPSVDTSTAGFTCFVIVALQSRYFWKMINFLSVGSVESYYVIPNSEIELETSSNVAIIYNDVLPLYHDGFCMIGVRHDNLNNIQGNLYNITEGKIVKGNDWGIPLVPRIKYSALNNGTIWSAVPGEDNSGTFWYVISNDLYKSKGEDESGYENKKILSTIPPINGTVSKDIKSVIIQYKEPVILSAGFISIYEKSYNNDGSDLLRQTFSASSKYVHYVNGTSNTEVEVEVLSSTFNQFNSSYYITVDDNFVRDQNFSEPLLGIGSGVWMINTGIPNDQKFTDDKDVLLRLNLYGTIIFQFMGSLERDAFFDNLLISFSQSIPIPLERLHTPKRYQFDGMKDDLPILISIQLKATRNKNKEEMNTEQILDNMDILIRNKLSTKLNYFENASTLLDPDFGAKEIVNVWAAYRYQIAGVICAIFILCVVVFLAHNTHPTYSKNGISSMSLFKLIVIFVDFIMDVVFLFYNGRDISYLYTPRYSISLNKSFLINTQLTLIVGSLYICSVILLLAPLSVNFFITMFIFLREYYRNTSFANFARENSLTTTILLVLGYIDLISLEFLSSGLANIPILSAPFDEMAEKAIYWGSFGILLIEDLPQLVVQIIYSKSVIVYKFVPLLTLTTGSLIILTNLIGRSYDCYKNIRDRYIYADEEYQENNNSSGRGEYLIGVDKVDEIFNKWWEIGSGKASSTEGSDEKEKGKGKSKEDSTEGSGVGDEIELNTDVNSNDTQVVAGPSENTTISNKKLM